MRIFSILLVSALSLGSVAAHAKGEVYLKAPLNVFDFNETSCKTTVTRPGRLLRWADGYITCDIKKTLPVNTVIIITGKSKQLITNKDFELASNELRFTADEVIYADEGKMVHAYAWTKDLP